MLEALDDGGRNSLNKVERDTVDRVIKFYAHHDYQWLTDLIMMEEPWKEARLQGLERENEIKPESLIDYYGNLPPEDNTSKHKALKLRSIIDNVMRVMRIVVMFSFAGWAAAAAATGLWLEMLFFISFILIVYFTGIAADKSGTDR
jgi:hypothetical protein